MKLTFTAFPVTTRITGKGLTQYTQRYQGDQDGAPSYSFARTSMKEGGLLPAGPVFGEGEFTVKRFKNEQTGYSDEHIVMFVRNLRVVE
jgi:hypothetical protein